jgi:hydrogenase/urease accessory protein HupE
MKFTALGFNRLLRISAVFVILGLAVETGSLLWFHPLSFVTFALLGGLLILTGMAAYLFSVLLFAASPNQNTSSNR